MTHIKNPNPAPAGHDAPQESCATNGMAAPQPKSSDTPAGNSVPVFAVEPGIGAAEKIDFVKRWDEAYLRRRVLELRKRAERGDENQD